MMMKLRKKNFNPQPQTQINKHLLINLIFIQQPTIICDDGDDSICIRLDFFFASMFAFKCMIMDNLEIKSVDNDDKR